MSPFTRAVCYGVFDDEFAFVAALGLLVIIVVAIATSGQQRIKLCKPTDEVDRIDWLYLAKRFMPS